LATEYAFTDYGLTLKPILIAMADWGTRRQRMNG
jgi:DNA-binding HxlR family transcriptional regulator